MSSDVEACESRFESHDGKKISRVDDGQMFTGNNPLTTKATSSGEGDNSATISTTSSNNRKARMSAPRVRTSLRFGKVTFADTVVSNNDQPRSDCMEPSRASIGRFTMLTANNRMTVAATYVDMQSNEEVPILIEDSQDDSTSFQAIRSAIEGGHIVVQCIATFASCIFVYSLSNQTPYLSTNISSFLLVVLIGSNFQPIAAPVAAGAYAGMCSRQVISSYGWLVLLATVITAVWQLIVRFKLFLGYSGRLGTSAFISTNLTLIVAVMPSGDVSWTKYASSEYWGGGALQVVPSVALVGCTIFGALLAGTYRIHSAVPRDAIVSASSVALLCFLITSVTEYRNTAQVTQGFGVGAFVGMTALDRLPSKQAFALCGLFAGLWGILWMPFFQHFGGVEGFTALCGYVTYNVLMTGAGKVSPRVGQLFGHPHSSKT